MTSSFRKYQIVVSDLEGGSYRAELVGLPIYSEGDSRLGAMELLLNAIPDMREKWDEQLSVHHAEGRKGDKMLEHYMMMRELLGDKTVEDGITGSVMFGWPN